MGAVLKILKLKTCRPPLRIDGPRVKWLGAGSTYEVMNLVPWGAKLLFAFECEVVYLHFSSVRL